MSNNGKAPLSKEEVLVDISKISSGFERMYTSANKLVSTFNEGRTQINPAILSLKKKTQELNAMMQGAQDEINKKNGMLAKLQEQMKELPQGQEDKIKRLEGQMADVSASIKSISANMSATPTKGVLCRGLVAGTDTITQILSRVKAEQEVLRDAIRVYLGCIVESKKSVSSNSSPKIGVSALPKVFKETLTINGGKMKKQKGTVDRMCDTLLRSATVIVELGNQVGVELPLNILDVINNSKKISSPVGAPSHGSTLVEIMRLSDAQIKEISHIARTEKDITDNISKLDAKIDCLATSIQQMDNVISTQHDALQKVVTDVQAVVNIAMYEIDPLNFTMPPVRTIEEAALKLRSLIKAFYAYLVPSLVATPLVYLHDKDWKMSNHADFRAKQRTALDALAFHVKPEMPLDALRECILEFGQIMMSVFHLKIPAMGEVYPDDFSHFTMKNWTNERQGLRDELTTELEKLTATKTKGNPNTICTVMQNLLRILMKFLTYKPVGRPHVYVSDTEWQLVDEAKIRFELRKELLL